MKAELHALNVSPPEACRILGVSDPTLRVCVRAGDLEARRSSNGNLYKITLYSVLRQCGIPERVILQMLESRLAKVRDSGERSSPATCVPAIAGHLSGRDRHVAASRRLPPADLEIVGPDNQRRPLHASTSLDLSSDELARRRVAALRVIDGAAQRSAAG